MHCGPRAVATITRLAVMLCALGATACIESRLVVCKDNLLCPVGSVCDDVHGGCATAAQITDCRGKAEQATCSYPGVPDGGCFDGVCLPAGCGNAVVNSPETCDDGNRFHGDGCSADCLSNETCGNGSIDVVKGEACDDGNVVSGDGCHANCVLPTCGDGIVDLDRFEQCDNGAANSITPDAACRPTCQPRRCGDNVVDTQELCDDGNVLSSDGCSSDCASLEVCGNGYLDVATGEQCDDGDVVDGNGCQADCKAPYCGDGIVDASLFEECDNGAANSMAPDACRPTCRLPGCGDQVIDANEVCDDGNAAPGDGCFFNCESDETCGNGYVDFSRGEPCDDGNALSHDGCATCQLEVALWTAVGAAIPGARNEHALAYDARRGRLVMFGGFAPGGVAKDTWEWNRGAWTEVTPISGNPPARRRHALAYDAARGQVVLFSGLSTGGNDTWVWNGSGWRNATPTTGNPPARDGHALTYDAARERIVLFGGIRNGVRLADTWEWDGITWTNVTPSSGNPAFRDGVSMTYDAARGRVVMFGGLGVSDVLLNDTWEWSGSAWTNVTPGSTSPLARKDHALAYDASRQRVVLFGGANGNVRLSDTWEWNGVAWTNVTLASGNPAGRQRHALAYDATRGRIVLFGGINSSGISLSDTWEWSGTTWTDVTGLAATPPTRANSAFAYDAGRGRAVLFGGRGSTPELGDTWEWTGNAWVDRTPASGSPAMRNGHAMAYDGNDVVLFGGSTGSAETWKWNGTSWAIVTAGGGPPPRFDHAMAYDSARSRVVLFGGDFSEVRDDTWEWNGSAWANVTPVSGSPSARREHALAYDAARGVIVLFGGSAGAAFDDTWEWDGTTWRNATPASGSPQPRLGHTLAYDAARGRVVMFGGISAAGTPLDDAWEWNGSQWTDLLITSASPSPRWHHEMAYDAANRSVVLFGGLNGQYFGDIWTLRFQGKAAEERCLYGLDGDGDGLVGCADPDCFGYCSPLCNPTIMTCAPVSPRCGDGVCQAIETQRLCPADCGVPAPLCGDFLCESPETAVNCPGDCS